MRDEQETRFLIAPETHAQRGRENGFLSDSRGYLYVALAAILWGTLGLFYRVLHDEYHLPSLTIAFLRVSLTAIALIAFSILKRPDAFKISRRDLPLFILFGFFGVAATNFLYVQSVVTTSVTTAVVLLYTAPAFVSVIAWKFWREPLNARKIIAIAIAFLGCALIARAYAVGESKLNVLGLFLGVGAGFTYALYTIFSKFALERHSSLTALIYALAFGAIFLAPFQSLENFAPLVQQPSGWIYVLGLVAAPSVGAMALYNAGLTRVPASNASLVATLEPVMASVLAYFVLGERLEIAQMIGGALVVIAAVWVRAGEAYRGLLSRQK
jgi:drug/metabolite transporter (DMT)-like permease